MCKTFKVKFLKIPRLKVPAKKTASNLFYKDIWETKKWLKGVTISQARAIISKKSNKVKASEKKSTGKQRNDDMKGPSEI